MIQQGFSFLAKHHDDPYIKNVICQLTTGLDPNPIWARQHTLYGPAVFEWAWNQSKQLTLSNVADPKYHHAPDAWVVQAECSAEFHAVLASWHDNLGAFHWANRLGISVEDFYALQPLIELNLYHNLPELRPATEQWLAKLGYALSPNYTPEARSYMANGIQTIDTEQDITHV